MPAKIKIAHLAGPNATNPEHPAARHIQQGTGEAQPSAAQGHRGQRREVRRAAAAEAGRARDDLCRAAQRPSARGRRGFTLRPAGRLSRMRKESSRRSARATRTAPSIRSKSSRRTATTRCPIWRAAPTAAHGRPTAFPSAPRAATAASRSCRTAPAPSMRSTGSASPARASAT